MDMRKLVGRNVRAARKAIPMTQEQLAEAAGFSQQYISGLECGRRNPTIVTLYELAQVLKTTPVDSIAPPEDE
jgi:transcriptional regulator with XRE-family HTH domain